MSKIAIIADSGCQIDINGEHEGIYIAPLCIGQDNRTYLDQLEITSLDVFNKMKETDAMFTTSQPSTGALMKAMEEAKKDGYDELIGIPIATGLSSTLNGMKVAADSVEMPITLVDSMGTAHIQKKLVEAARTLVEKGKAVAEIKEKLEDMVKHSGTIIFTPNLNHLKRGGRITPAVAMLGNMLKLVPVMELNSELGGKIDTLGKVRTTRKACKLLADRAIERGANAKDYTFAIEDVLAEDERQRVRDYLEEKLGPCNVTMRELPTVVGAHMGIGGVGIQFIKNLAE